ncbi:MAG TPA: flagellar basal body rod protein FlgB [Candidatus Limnocylindria bacterium]|nr:flagellar basal body rod protein FlgB [Candidatus Limnocylindria bacterium]
MIEALFNQPGYLAAQRMLDAAVVRHEAIASNIANQETPNYKRLDVAPNFSAQLNSALASKDAGQLKSLQPRLAVDTSATSPNRDGNTVNIEQELLAMNQNQIVHTLETQLVTGTLMKLRLAITGRSG